MPDFASFSLWDLTQFSPVISTMGGVVMGCCSLTMLAYTGKVLGLSGGVRGLFLGEKDWNTWRLTFVLGLCGGGLLARLTHPNTLQAPPDDPELWWRFILGGLLTGLGTPMCNGCTSGHGITGISRLSLTSLVATMTFMVAAIVFGTATAVQSDIPHKLREVDTSPLSSPWLWAFAGVSLLSAGGLICACRTQLVPKNSVSLPIIFVCLVGFSTGLVISGMSMPAKIAGFLDVFSPTGWDPSLVFVMVGAHLVHMPLMHFTGLAKHISENYTTLCGEEEMSCPRKPRHVVDWNIIGGATMFGMGWGISALCPGPAAIVLFAPPLTLSAIFWNVSFIIGAFVHKYAMRTYKSLQRVESESLVNPN